MNLIDCHTHTQFSMDSEADINEMINRAIELGLKAYAITDHCECNCWFPEDHYENTENFDYFNYAQDFENSLNAVTALKEKCDSEINLICGTEMGQAIHDLEIAEKVVSDERLVLLSVLFIRRWEKKIFFTLIIKICVWMKFTFFLTNISRRYTSFAGGENLIFSDILHTRSAI